MTYVECMCEFVKMFNKNVFLSTTLDFLVIFDGNFLVLL
jgi:hypothetical protein